MNRILFALFALALTLAIWLGAAASATETTPRLFDKSIARITSDVSWVDVTAADYTGYQTLLTVTPDNNNALNDVRIVVDLNPGDGFATLYTTETIRFALARKIYGNWRIDAESQTTAISGDNSDARCVTLSAGLVGATEQIRLVVLVSAENGDCAFPVQVYYRSGASVTITTVSN